MSQPLQAGDLVWWLDDERHPIPARIALVTRYRCYLEATGSQSGPQGRRVWYVPLGLAHNRIAARDRTYTHQGRAYHPSSDTYFKIDPGHTL